ncbi:uncharacterized protein si:ch211-1a19.3 [Astyanax mexicanus]|uniref:uncharacterized protein si:ch211-1a19.3 n=1 Tax=Astyanax mexicanus TaxID=7994 RepID=UPI0020CAA4AD|nr:uncharacterized protein si:ch211-1a19.3 [Astyanax mexicanus]
MTSSKSSQTTRNIVITCLALWSVISLIIIVVWATSPDLKGASQCRAELQALQKTFDEEKAVWGKDREALENMVREGWHNQSVLQENVNLLMEQLKELNLTLETCFQNNTNLKENITLLEKDIEVHKAIEANLTAEISQRQDLIENLQLNLTQTVSELESCNKLHKAAMLLQTAAEKQKDACQTRRQYLEKQLMKCQNTIQSSHNHGTEAGNDGPPGPQSGLAMVVIVGISLLLVP